MLIGELSERTGVSRRALRYYEDQGLLVPARARNGYREYAEDAPLIVDQIQGMYAAGLDSEAIRRYLPCAEGHKPRLTLCPGLRARLLDRAAALDAQAAAIDRQRATLAAHLGSSATADPVSDHSSSCQDGPLLAATAVVTCLLH